MGGRSNSVKWRSAAVANAAKAARGQADLGLCAPTSRPGIDDDERYTQRETIAWCLERAGCSAFDLDVAACEESHHAPRWFDINTNGLAQPWTGRVWCNPPFSDCGAWVDKAWTEWGRPYGPVVIAMLLPATRTEQGWWQKGVERYRDRHGSDLYVDFLPGRTRFGIPGNPLGIGVGSPPFGCVLLVWRQSMGGR